MTAVKDRPTKPSQPAPARIIEAAKTEFARHGLSGGRIEEIARVAGVSQQLVFHYFQNKETLYAEALSSLADESAEFVRGVDFDAMHPVDAIEYIVRGVFRENLKYGARFIADQILQGGAQISSRNRIWIYHSELHDLIDSILRRGRDLGLFSATVTARELLIATVSLSLGQSAAHEVAAGPASAIFGRPPSVGRAWTEFGVSFIRSALTNLRDD